MKKQLEQLVMQMVETSYVLSFHAIESLVPMGNSQVMRVDCGGRSGCFGMNMKYLIQKTNLKLLSQMVIELFYYLKI
jgi:hypothetical protein